MGDLAPRVRSARAWLAQVGPVTFLVVVCTWVVLLPVSLMSVTGDYGVWISVADRLRAGERLYAGVWDNKDPLVYMLLASARSVDPHAGWLLAVAVLALIACASVSLGRSLGLEWRMSMLGGAACVPVIVTGMAWAGNPPPLGVAFAFIAVAAALRERWLLSGAMLAASAFSWILLVPVAVAMVGVILIGQGKSRDLWRITVGLGLMSIVILGVLLVRGELAAYAESLVRNVAYSQEGSTSTGLRRIVERLQVTLFAPSMTVSLVTGLLALMLAQLERRGGSLPSIRGAWRRDETGILIAASSIGILMGIVVLALTGKWGGHARVLSLPLSACFLLALAAGPSILRRRSTLATGAVLALCLLVAGVPPAAPFVEKVLYARGNFNAQAVMSEQALLMQQLSEPTTYARVGQGDDPGHAIGLENWMLACPRITQYPWEPPTVLDQTANCLPNAEVILTTDPNPLNASSPQWEVYLGRVEAILARGYDCVKRPDFRVCVRRPG